MIALGRLLVGTWVLLAIGAPWIAPYASDTQFRDHPFAPPTTVRVMAEGGGLVRPFIRPQRLEHLLERTYAEDASTPVPLAWFRDGRLVRPADAGVPLFLLGADGLGRDLFSRLVHGARRSLLLAGLATLAALAIGAALGTLAGFAGGRLDRGIMRVADLAIVLPALYVLLALRAALPLYVPPGTTVVYMLVLFAAVGWPMPARGVRAIIAAEREREYVLAAIAAGASRTRVLVRHLAPASLGFLRTQAALLLPAFVVAEATLSFVGLGFPDHAPSWGSLLQDTANLGVLGTAPWLVAPAVVLFSVVLGVNLTLDHSARAGAALGLAPAARNEPRVTR
jgi:peptide/nickel transport system permease protein